MTNQDIGRLVADLVNAGEDSASLTVKINDRIICEIELQILSVEDTETGAMLFSPSITKHTNLQGLALN